MNENNRKGARMKFKNFIYPMIGVSFYISFPALAGKIQIVNENQQELKVKIVAEGDSWEEDLAKYVQHIPASYHSVFTVKSSDLKGKSHFSIKGETYPFAEDKCRYLSVDRNYKVTFISGHNETKCVYEVVP
jgi:hypothetical protein